MAKYYTEPLKAAGKALIALGNVGAALLFVQSYWTLDKLSGLIASIIWLMGCYSAGMILVGMGYRREPRNANHDEE